MLKELKACLREAGYAIRDYRPGSDGFFVDGEDKTVSVQPKDGGVWLSNEEENEAVFKAGQLREATSWVQADLG